MHNARRWRPLRQQLHQAALGQLFLTHIVRQPAHAAARQSGKLQRQQIIGHITRLQLQAMLLALRPHQQQAGVAIHGRHGQAIQQLQVIQRLGGALTFQQIRAGHQNLTRDIQPLDHHGATVVQA